MNTRATSVSLALRLCSCACLTVALVLAPGVPGAAQSQSPQAPPAAGRAEVGPGVQPQPKPASQPEPKPAESKRQRQSRRTRRTSDRQTSSSSAPEVFPANFNARDAGPLRNELALTANLLGGYDDNLTGGLGTGTGTVPTAMVSGSTGYLDAALDYFRGNNLRSIRLESTGNLRAYPDYFDEPVPGGAASVVARTTLGRKHRAGMTGQVRYEPLFTAGTFGADGGAVPPPTGGTAPVTGLLDRRALTTTGSAFLERQWSRPDSTRLSYAYSDQDFTEDDYGDNSRHTVGAEYRRRLSRGAGLRTAYSYEHGEYTNYGEPRAPIVSTESQTGPEIQKALSRRNRLALSAAGGASYVESVSSASNEPYDYWVPTGSATARLDVASRWWLNGGYRRDFSVLQGLTDELYTTDTAFLATGGIVNSRVTMQVGGTFNNGQTPVASGVSEDFTIYGASLQTRVALTSTVSAFAGYFYYRHRYSNPAALPTGFPGEYDRNAVRVGIAVWVPLAGSVSAPQMPFR